MLVASVDICNETKSEMRALDSKVLGSWKQAITSSSSSLLCWADSTSWFCPWGLGLSHTTTTVFAMN